MPRDSTATDRLDSWKEIAAYVGRDVRTVIRWEQRGGLPVYRVPVGQRQAVYAYKREIDDWMVGDAPGRAELAAALEIAAEHPDWTYEATAMVEAQPAAETPRAGRSHLRFSARIAVWLGAAVLLVIATVLFFSVFSRAGIVLGGETQITDDNAIKTDLITDGRYLYFGETREGRIVLSRVSVHGGPIKEILTPFVHSYPMSISRDGQRLLVLAGAGEEQEHSLWIVREDGGRPVRVGDFLCHAAAWSPDGKRIAYASGNSIYLTADTGATSRPIHTFAAIPEVLRWSLDGRRLVTRLRDTATWNSALWEIGLGGVDRSTVSSLIPVAEVQRDYNALSIIDQDDNAFVGTGRTLWLMHRNRWPWQSGFTLAELSTEMNSYSDLAVDPVAHRLYVTREVPANNELDRFEKKSHQFQPFLPGVSARDVDFSRDGRWIVYVREPENTLWIGTADGSTARQLATPGMVSIELPRWSPDGRRIAFMGKRAFAPYRIFVTAAVGGPLSEASRGTDNQGAPTWSPDGHHLVYGRVFCQEEKTCAIKQINLDTGGQIALPGSEGLSTARWSPDGRFIAALRPEKHEVYVLSLRNGKWRKLADDANGNDLAWAPDSRRVYASKPSGDRPEVIQIPLEGSKVEPAVDLTDFSKLSGRVDTWFAVTPDDSILFLRIVSGHEIWAVDYKMH